MADNRRYVYQRLRGELGLTAAQAAGAVGGLGGESGRTLDPNAVNSTSGALGIGQWLGGRARGVKKGDLRSQTNHLIAELKGPERAALNRLRSAHTIQDATRAWVEGFERPSPSEIASSMPARLGYARDAFQAFHGLQGGASSGGSLVGNTDSSGGSQTPGVSPDFGTAANLVPLLQALRSQPQQRSSAGIAAPAFSAAPTLPGGYQSPMSGGGPSPSGMDTNALLTAMRTLGGSTPQAQTQGQPASADGSSASASFSTPKAQSGVASFDGKKVAAWIAPALEYARKHGWKGTVNSGYRSFADQTRIYNSGVRPAAKPGTSNHEGTQYPRGAVDVSDAARLAEILRRSPYGGRLKWAGSKDPVHFSHPHGGGY